MTDQSGSCVSTSSSLQFNILFAHVEHIFEAAR